MTARLRLIGALVAAALLFAQDDGRRVAPFSGRRLALVVGNQAYPWKPLTNPVNDARAVARALEQDGFARRDIRVVLDAGQTELRRSVREFVESVKPGDLALVYYSGHGVEVKGSNYLLPVDLPSDATEGYVQDEAVSAQRVLRDLEDQGARVRVMILDACRDNPLRAAKSTRGGLAPMEGKGTLVVFATEAGQTASDNRGENNGLFTRYLLDGLRMPGISLDDAMKRVSRNVAQATGEKQVPAIYGLLLEDVILVPAPPVPAMTSVNLSAAFDTAGIISDGRSFVGGLDGGGWACSANQLGPSRTVGNVPFTFGPANAPDVVSGGGKAIALPRGRFSRLHMLATGVGGHHPGQVFRLTYADGSFTTFVQSVSDWYAPQLFPGESVAVAMDHRNTSSGVPDNRPFYLYGYSFALDAGKAPAGLSLPAEPGVKVLALTLSQ
jgi:hypothetical protein